MGRAVGCRRRERGPGFFPVLVALIVLSLTGAGAIVWPLFLILVGATVLTMAWFTLRLVLAMGRQVMRALTR